MKAPYYKHDGSATKNLLEKLALQKELDLVLVDLRYATGVDRQELLERRDNLKDRLNDINV